MTLLRIRCRQLDLSNSEKRELYTKWVLNRVPSLLSLIDRNKFSPTYGCFDRNYWHYKIIDFPNGMVQAGSLAFALLYKYNFTNNTFYKNERMKELCFAAIAFAEKSSNKDGSCDEFYPYERALGATAFSLYACTESYLILEMDNENFERFFMKRGDWILENDEPGEMANHHAGAALALVNVYMISKKEKYLKGAQKKIKQTLQWMSEEGWFREYEGCDPGYLTFAIDFLAKYYKKTGDKKLLTPLEKAIKFSSYFIHPDGSYGGEYGSRNTYHFQPHGYEILGKQFPLATQIADKFLEGLRNNKTEFMDDYRYLFYYMNNYLQAYLDFNTEREGKIQRTQNFEKHFPEAKMYITKKDEYYVIISLAKGGVVKIFKGNKNIYSDCGLIGLLDNNKLITSQTIDEHSIEVDKEIKISGYFGSVNTELMSTSKLILFRCALSTLGKSNKLGNAFKNFLTKRLILGSKREKITFERSFNFEKDIIIIDKIKILGKRKFKTLAIGSDPTLIHVPTSRYFQESVLNEWIDLKEYIPALNKNREIEIKRIIS